MIDDLKYYTIAWIEMEAEEKMVGVEKLCENR